MYKYKLVSPHLLHDIYDNGITRSCVQSYMGSDLVIRNARTRYVSSMGSSSIDWLQYHDLRGRLIETLESVP
jgi:hypothetical protein